MTSPRARFVLTLVLALAAGGVVGAGVAWRWYGPAVAVILAALIGLGVGLQVRRATINRVGRSSASDT